jgi:hypothetical protein
VLFTGITISPRVSTPVFICTELRTPISSKVVRLFFIHTRKDVIREAFEKREKTKKLKKQSKRLKLKEPDLDDDIKNIKTMVNFLLSYMEKGVDKKNGS